MNGGIINLGPLFFFSFVFIFLFVELKLDGKCHVVSSDGCTWFLSFPKLSECKPIQGNQGVLGFSRESVAE